MKEIKILIINPVKDIPKEINQKRLNHLKKLACPTTRIEITNLDEGTVAVTSEHDLALVTPIILKKVKEVNESNRFDAIINSCAADPALEESRKISKIPIIGTGEASHILASFLGDKYSIVTVSENGIVDAEIYYDIARKLGLESKLASIRYINMSALELRDNPYKAIAPFIEKSIEAVKKDGAEVIVPGCGYFSELALELQKKLGIPVIDPAGAALKMAETLVSLSLIYTRMR